MNLKDVKAWSWFLVIVALVLYVGYRNYDQNGSIFNFSA